MSKLVKAIRRVRADQWETFKGAISLPGYHYYKPPAALKYRYPAPGSCPLTEKDHPHMYKDDWREPYRTSDYNIRPIELKYTNDDPR